MTKDSNGRLDDFCISPKIRNILLQWSYELVESDLLFCSFKNELCWFNRQELLKKAKVKYHNGSGKEKDAEYYLKNRGF